MNPEMTFWAVTWACRMKRRSWGVRMGPTRTTTSTISRVIMYCLDRFMDDIYPSKLEQTRRESSRTATSMSAGTCRERSWMVQVAAGSFNRDSSQTRRILWPRSTSRSSKSGRTYSKTKRAFFRVATRKWKTRWPRSRNSRRKHRKKRRKIRSSGSTT